MSDDEGKVFEMTWLFANTTGTVHKSQVEGAGRKGEKEKPYGNAIDILSLLCDGLLLI